MLFLTALLYGNQLERAYEDLASSDPERVERAYNGFKTLYIRSILENDSSMKVEALKGLVQSCDRLKIECKDYRQKLNALLQRDKNRKKNSLPHKTEKTRDQSRTKEVKKESLPKISSIYLKKGYIELKFDKRPEPPKSFSINDGKKGIYKRVYDIKAVWPYVFREYSPKGLKRVKIAQFDKKTTRVVLEGDRAIGADFKIENTVLKIGYLKGILDERESKIVKNEPIPQKKPKKTAKKAQTGNLLSFDPRTKTVVIDPGHGGKDAGAVGYKRKREKDAVLAIAKRLYGELKRRGYKVYLTRTKDYFVPLRNRTRYANRRMADIFISIHANAAPKKSKYLSMKGIETFFLSPARSERAKKVAALENRADLDSMGYYSKQTFLNFLNREKIIASNKLALDVQRGMLYNLRKRYDVTDGGVREGPFWVLVGAQMPSILIEIGYITNPTEAKRLFNPAYQKLLAKGIADGIDSYFEKN